MESNKDAVVTILNPETKVAHYIAFDDLTHNNFLSLLNIAESAKNVCLFTGTDDFRERALQYISDFKKSIT